LNIVIHTNKRGDQMKAMKEFYVQPVLTKHELLRDITAGYSGSGGTRDRIDRIERIICRFFPGLPRCR